GAEMLRLACCLGTERGIEICAPVHDAVLIAAPLYRFDEDVGVMQDAMREASSVVLGGVELTSDVKLVRYPGRYVDVRGEEMWRRVMLLIGEEKLAIVANVAPEGQQCRTSGTQSIFSTLSFLKRVTA